MKAHHHKAEKFSHCTNSSTFKTYHSKPVQVVPAVAYIRTSNFKISRNHYFYLFLQKIKLHKTKTENSKLYNCCNKMKVRTNSALVTFLVSSQVSSAKSFLSVSIDTRTNEGSTTFKRPNAFESSSVLANDFKPKTSRVHKDMLSLRAGGIGSLPTLSSLNTFFKQYPYVAAFVICK